MIAFWKYGVSIRVYGLFWYAGYNPDYPVLFSERYGFQKVYRFCGFVFKFRNLRR